MSPAADHERTDGRTEALRWDYERSLDLFNHLADIRFKLASFIPLLTGAAVALLTTGVDVTDTQQTTLAGGGLVFLVGITIYDLRNSGIYNAMVGRLQHLEDLLDLPSFDGKAHYGGAMRSRDALRQRRFLGIPISHSVGLSMAYAPAFGAWIWAALEAWIDSDIITVAVAAGATAVFGAAYYGVDP